MDAETAARLEAYLTLLLEANDRVNLTAARTVEELQTRHLEDCLELIKLPVLQQPGRVLDVGTGGGLPGIPLAIACPHLEVTLLDATQKKIREVQGFIDALELTHARAVAGRAEELGHDPAWRHQFDVVVSRALAPLPSLLEYLLPFVKVGGHVVAFKGSDAEQELAAASHAMRQLKAVPVARHTYQMRELTFSLLVLQLKEPCPRRYPRGQGQVRRAPL